MSISAIGKTTSNYAPQKAGSQDNSAQLESKLNALNKQLKEVRQNDKLEPEKKKKQIEDIEKKIAEMEKRIAQMKQNGNNTDELQIEDVKEQDSPNETLASNHLIDKYI